MAPVTKAPFTGEPARKTSRTQESPMHSNQAASSAAAAERPPPAKASVSGSFLPAAWDGRNIAGHRSIIQFVVARSAEAAHGAEERDN